MIVVAFHTELNSYYLQEVPLLNKEVTDVLTEIKRRQSETFPTDSMSKDEDDNSRSAASSSVVDNGNVLPSQANQSPALRRDSDIPF